MNLRPPAPDKNALPLDHDDIIAIFFQISKLFTGNPAALMLWTKNKKTKKLKQSNIVQYWRLHVGKFKVIGAALKTAPVLTIR